MLYIRSDLGTGMFHLPGRQVTLMFQVLIGIHEFIEGVINDSHARRGDFAINKTKTLN